MRTGGGVKRTRLGARWRMKVYRQLEVSGSRTFVTGSSAPR
ncbi:hypothetical protein P9314_26025 [Paenibacillus validus]|nr:hypothetical protein [Paenibacillus validus]MED4604091.1 hypothetical protein [Paenibacillus validus]MED4607810.1 hypothetical protein [Paenibacillus validus]